MVRGRKKQENTQHNGEDGNLESIRNALTDAANFAPNAINILKSIAEGLSDENITISNRIDAVKALFDILNKSGFKSEISGTKKNEVKQLTEKEKEILEAEKLILYQRRLEMLNDDLHLLPGNHPLYQPKNPCENDIEKMKRRWNAIYPEKPYPKTESALREFYEDDFRKVTGMSLEDARKLRNVEDVGDYPPLT